MRQTRRRRPMHETKVSPPLRGGEIQLTRAAYICNTYHPPSGNLENFIDILEQKLSDFYIEGQCDILVAILMWII